MRYADQPALRQLANAISDTECGDQRLDARFELYVFEDHHHPGSLSAASPLQAPAKSPISLTRHFINALSETYPDYQFSGLTYDSFARRDDLGSVVNKINQALGTVLERPLPGILSDVWRTLRSVVSFPDCEVYELVEDPIDEAKLWSFCYFWFDRRYHRFLLLSCRARSRLFRNSSDSEASLMSWEKSSMLDD